MSQNAGNRIEAAFETSRAAGRKALITFLTAGDPDYDRSLSAIKTLAASGADIIELGMPFTDPGADGPVIQLANQRALKAGANMGQTLRIVRDFRAKNQSTALVLMGYYNPVMAYGSERFIFDAKAAGVDGLIIVDLPPEEDQELRALCKAQGIDLIRLLTPTSDEKRLKTLLEGVSGFLYYVSITGVTGTASANLAQLEPHLDMIRQHTDLPIAIGFGIKTPEDAAQMARIGDAVVVGSALIGLLNGDSGVEQDSSLAALGQFTQKLAAAL